MAQRSQKPISVVKIEAQRHSNVFTIVVRNIYHQVLYDRAQTAMVVMSALLFIELDQTMQHSIAPFAVLKLLSQSRYTTNHKPQSRSVGGIPQTTLHSAKAPYYH